VGHEQGASCACGRLFSHFWITELQSGFPCVAIEISAKTFLRHLGRGIGRRLAPRTRNDALAQQLMIEPDPEALKAWRALLVRDDRT
jgi:hypothetical protein